jgi:YD repeat-containing protein
MKFILITSLILFALTAEAGTHDRSTEARIYDRQGRYIGKSETRGDTARLYDKDGHYQGKKVTKGNTTELFDKQGHSQGKAVSR